MKELNRNLLLSFFTFCFLLFLSCKKTNETAKNQVISEIKESVSDDREKRNEELSRNEKVVSRLKEMKSAFENENSEEMLQFFEFPTKNFMFIRKSEEFRKKIAANNNEITREHFLEYAKIQKKSNHPSLYQLLVTLNLDSLKKLDSIKKDLEIEDDECYYMYQIEIENDIVILSYGSNSNQKYSDEGDCSERHTFLYFRIINNMLKFERSDSAG